MQTLKFIKFRCSSIIKISAKYYINSLESNQYEVHNQKKYFLIAASELISLGLKIPKIKLA